MSMLSQSNIQPNFRKKKIEGEDPQSPRMDANPKAFSRERKISEEKGEQRIPMVNKGAK